MEWLVAAVLVLLLLFVPYGVSHVRNVKRRKRVIEALWGRRDRTGFFDPIKDFTVIAGLHQGLTARDPNRHTIDDITWNDLSMNDVYERLNHTMSVCGEHVLYHILRTPHTKDQELIRNTERLRAFVLDPKACKALQYVLFEYGKSRSYDITQPFFAEKMPAVPSVWRCIVQDALLLMSLPLLFINLSYGVWTACLLALNIVTHYTGRKKIERQMGTLSWMTEMLRCAKRLDKLRSPLLDQEAFPIAQKLRAVCSKRAHAMYRFIFESRSVGVEYLKAAFQAERIAFGAFMRLLHHKRDEYRELFHLIGRIDASIAIASYRASAQRICEPSFLQTGAHGIEMVEAVHPLIDEPVANDVSVDGCMLVTGSNASGKSTFIKMVTLNVLLAQTVGFCHAQRYRAAPYRVYTSMALRDDLAAKESYYIVEIKSIKRILDAAADAQNILCAVDEVLRGTNTVERIAASLEILITLQKSGVLCLAATHDHELCDLLHERYINVHFQEHVDNEHMHFDYKLYPGKTESRNAIRLLALLGYDRSLVERAEQRATGFLKHGSWKSTGPQADV